MQRSPLLADGTKDPAFTNVFNGSFGLAWYQSDIQVQHSDNGHVRIQTILLDDIFGFDPDVRLAPTNTFHVGFWFDDPNAAKTVVLIRLIQSRSTVNTNPARWQ